MKIIKQETVQSNWYPSMFLPPYVKICMVWNSSSFSTWGHSPGRVWHQPPWHDQRPGREARGMEAGFLLEQPGGTHRCWGPYATKNYPTRFQPRLGTAQGLTAKLSACSNKCKSLFAYILWQKWQPDKSWRIPERHPLDDILHTISDHRKIGYT